MSSVSGEVSRRHVPTRTLPQPASLGVAQRDDAVTVTGRAKSDVQALKDDLTRRAELTRKAEKWMDRLMEDTPSLATVKKALSFLNPRQYQEVTHERHLNSLCSYPTCHNAPLAPYSSARRFRISTTNRTIQPKEGNEHEGFCSKRCIVRSDWVLGQLDHSPVWARTNVKIELLEEIERSKESATVPSPEESPTAPFVQHPSIPANAITPVVVTSAQAVLNDLAGKATPADLLSNLTIHERSTTDAIPTSPSLAPRQAAQTPSAPQLPQAESSSAVPTAPAKSTSRPKGSSLVATPSKLATSVLSASKKMGPVPQLPPDSDDEQEDEDWGEAEMGLTWGEEDSETRDLFRQAFEARDLLENQ